MRLLDRIHARPVLIGYGAVAGVLSLGIALVGSVNGPDPVVHFTWVAVASLAVLASIVAIAGAWTTAGMYAAVFWCFHFGLVSMLAGGLVSASDLSPWDQGWVVGPFVVDAALMALSGSLAFAGGAALVYARRRPTLTHENPEPTAEAAHPYGAGGSILVLAAVATWFGIVLTSRGLAGVFSSYSDYLELATEFPTAASLVWLTLGCGLILSATGRPGHLRRASLAAFGTLAVVSLPMGLRGEIMFQGVAALVAVARCGRTLSRPRAIALGTALLVAIPLIREVRQTGLRELPAALPDVSLSEAFTEMGSSLHPVEKVVRWRAEGDPLEEGSSYWAPFERAAARLLPSFQSAAADDDHRIMNILVLDRVGAIGFSPVAEAYRNFGALGVVLVLGLTGAAFAGIDTIRDRRTAMLTIAVVYPTLITNVRNSFISVPAYCAGSLAIVLALAAIQHVVESVICRSYARPAYIRSQV